MEGIFVVLKQGEAFAAPSKKSETGYVMKCVLLMRALGSKYADQYAVTLLGNDAGVRYHEGELVAASLRFTFSEHNGTHYQDVMANEIVKMSH